MPPPLIPAELPLIVLFSTVAPPEIPPPLVLAELPLMVLFTMLEPGTRPEPETEIPPPLLPVELPLMVLLATLREVLVAKIPPPPIVLKLPLMVQSIIVMYARPPKKCGAATTPPAELPLTVVLRIVAVTTPNSPVMLKIPVWLSLILLFTTVRLDPFSIPLRELPLMTQFMTVNMPPLIPTAPSLMVRPEMVAAPTEKTDWNWMPTIERWSAPGPEIVTFLATTSAPLVRVIVPRTAKVMRSPSCATASAWRNEPGPLSFVFVTVIVAACDDIIVIDSSSNTAMAMVRLIKRFVSLYRCRVERVNSAATISFCDRPFRRTSCGDRGGSDSLPLPGGTNEMCGISQRCSAMNQIGFSVVIQLRSSNRARFTGREYRRRVRSPRRLK